MPKSCNNVLSNPYVIEHRIIQNWWYAQPLMLLVLIFLVLILLVLILLVLVLLVLLVLIG